MTSPDRILLVDDNPTNLQVLLKTLEGYGYEILVATTGEQALSVAANARPDLILLDIMMPGIDGFETCQQLKADPDTRDSAIIFMSALNDTKDKVRGLDLGAVDYITKPFQAEEVIARVDTHLTIQRLQRDLAQRNADLNRINERMTSDLVAAAEVQQSLLPRTLPASDRVRFAWSYKPCDELAGDSLGIFRIDDHTIGMYVLDVAGHGVPAALLSVSVTHSIARRDADRTLDAPARVAAQLNHLFPMVGHRFFTIVYAVLDTSNGRLRYAGAGHPGPLIVRANGSFEALDSTGVPVGIVDGATFEDGETTVGPGDRVYLYSDGACEEMNENRTLFGVQRIESALVHSRSRPIDETLDALIESIQAWNGGRAFADDISLVAAEITGA